MARQKSEHAGEKQCPKCKEWTANIKAGNTGACANEDCDHRFWRELKGSIFDQAKALLVAAQNDKEAWTAEELEKFFARQKKASANGKAQSKADLIKEMEKIQAERQAEQDELAKLRQERAMVEAALKENPKLRDVLAKIKVK